VTAALEHFDLGLPNGIRLACRAAGVPGAPRVLLLHGFPEGAFIWDEVISALAGEARCVAPDMRGFGASTSPVEVVAYKARELVGDLVAAIDVLGGPLDLLVAHDWGGAVAWALAAQRPDLMRRLLIINSPHPATFLRELRSSRAQQEASAYMNFLCRPDAERLLAENGYARLFRFFGEPAWLTPRLREVYATHWTRGLTGGLNYYRASPLKPAVSSADAIHSLQLPDDAVTIKVPTTVLWGEGDVALLPGLLHGLERWVPRLDILREPQCTHWLVHERPALVADTIRRLLRPD
jgi:pimeloyl-ACP methyl ester carboxylesterase